MQPQILHVAGTESPPTLTINACSHPAQIRLRSRMIASGASPIPAADCMTLIAAIPSDF
jgi:hypothetical protein